MPNSIFHYSPWGTSWPNKMWRHQKLSKGFNRSQTSRAVANLFWMMVGLFWASDVSENSQRLQPCFESSVNAPWSAKIDLNYFTRFLTFFSFFCNKSFQKQFLFLSNQFEFQSNLLTNNPWKFEVAKEMGCFPILKFAEVTLLNLIISWPIFI